MTQLTQIQINKGIIQFQTIHKTTGFLGQTQKLFHKADLADYWTLGTIWSVNSDTSAGPNDNSNRDSADTGTPPTCLTMAYSVHLPKSTY